MKSPVPSKPKLKNYEVKIIAYATVLVTNCPNEEEALEAAVDAAHFGDFEMDEASIDRTVPPENNIERMKKESNCFVDFSEWSA